MKIKILVTALTLCLALPAAAQFTSNSEAYEVSLRGFSAPTNANGGVLFRPCSKCDIKRVRVTADTRYAVKGKRVRLEDFRRVIENVEDRDAVSITVIHHFESNTIVLLDVWL